MSDASCILGELVLHSRDKIDEFLRVDFVHHFDLGAYARSI